SPPNRGRGRRTSRASAPRGRTAKRCSCTWTWPASRCPPARPVLPARWNPLTCSPPSAFRETWPSAPSASAWATPRRRRTWPARGRSSLLSSARSASWQECSDVPEKVLVAMSGGVDSSVAAARLVEQGFEVVGATMKLFCYGDDVPDRPCCSLDSINDARDVAHALGIPHYVL